ncbi:hypothetical protein [Bradyrhizobium sp. LA6.7]|uniref:hypothetical protein n=1 Tax=unclassified Bradyrhizobium TaxID=2631580 RepID=UPI0033972E5F
MTCDQALSWVSAITAIAAFLAAAAAAVFALGQMRAAQKQLAILQEDRAARARVTRLAAAFRIFAATYDVEQALGKAIRAATDDEKRALLSYNEGTVARIEQCYGDAAQLTREEHIGFQILLVVARFFDRETAGKTGLELHNHIVNFYERINDLRRRLTNDIVDLPARAQS